MNHKIEKLISHHLPKTHELPQHKDALRRFLMHEAATQKAPHWKLWVSGLLAVSMVLLIMISPVFKNHSLNYQPYQKTFHSPQLKLMATKKESGRLYAQWKIQHYSNQRDLPLKNRASDQANAPQYFALKPLRSLKNLKTLC